MMTLKELEEKSIPWAEYFAGELNRLFREHGRTKQPGRITAATVRQGTLAMLKQREAAK